MAEGVAARTSKRTAATEKGDPMAAKEKSARAASPRSKTKAATEGRTILGRRKAPAPMITEGMIAERAYLISQSSECASELENWLRAEAELQRV
jgi:hypothetical protein